LWLLAVVVALPRKIGMQAGVARAVIVVMLLGRIPVAVLVLSLKCFLCRVCIGLLSALVALVRQPRLLLAGSLVRLGLLLSLVALLLLVVGQVLPWKAVIHLAGWGWVVLVVPLPKLAVPAQTPQLCLVARGYLVKVLPRAPAKVPLLAEPTRWAVVVAVLAR
jgi:hypothetical protein